ncbi:DUF268 domain-containing protein [Piscirickettsia litoralis]|uniref:DUF268 domain-containing protein n=1 Tax=Piscirickettsia litoralis TaxID=1891921 RepID=A0ABX3A4Q7_9GAMM|nr:DUF268 domain-containing protein [Piscirickettsia litoralis]ODN42651.1 hypothetical protein BGC07_06600 [Piscirickettsia litoralis]
MKKKIQQEQLKAITSGRIYGQPKKFYSAAPKKHIDIGSRIDGFISHLLVFRAVDVIDIRPMNSQIKNLSFIQDDATSLSNFKSDSIESISTLHAAEHFGLGRYGDPIDPSSHIKFINSLKRTLARDGKLYFAVPCGQEKLYFNAHRVFNPYTILTLFGELKLLEVSAVLDDGEFYENIDIDILAKQKFGCGLFEFTKI